MRIVVMVLLILASFNAYSEPDTEPEFVPPHNRPNPAADIPCMTGWEWGTSEYTFCPTFLFSFTTADTYNATEDSSKSQNKKVNLVINSKPYTAVYVASKDEINSAYLQEVFLLLRKSYPNTSYITLAEAILAY